VCRATGLHEGDVGDVLPQGQRGNRQRLLGRIQVAQIVCDRARGPMMSDGPIGLPISVDQIVGQLRETADRFCRSGRHRALTLLVVIAWVPFHPRLSTPSGAPAARGLMVCRPYRSRRGVSATAWTRATAILR